MSNLSRPRSTVSTRGRASSRVIRLVERIRVLVAEQRALEASGNQSRLAAVRREVDRLQWRLANVVRSELGNGGAGMQSPARAPC